MLTTIILLSFIAAAFWRETIKLVIAGVIVLLMLGIIQVVQLADDAGIVPSDIGGISAER